MDLNASPIPEEEEVEEEAFEPSLGKDFAPKHIAHVEHVESAVEISRREREERRQRLKRECSDDRSMQASQPPIYDQICQKNYRPYDRNKLPPVDPIISLTMFDVRAMLSQPIHEVLVLELGLVIDLTNTSRYYPASDCKKERIKQVKIQCKGRDSVPDNEAVNYFVYEVFQFLFHQKHSKKYVLVHCTHGHNRTGYMIIHYLMRTQSISVTQAIRLFADARPPGIYRPDYINALYHFYHEKKPDMLVCSSTPEWKRSNDLDLNGDAVPDEDDDGLPSAPLHVRGNTQFPGSHPVSLNRDNLQLLRQHYYYATWKADGTRYMMLITVDGCYLIDRNFNFRRVQMRFPCKSINEALAEMVHHFTLLDGEMVIDTLPDSQKQERRYLIYDLMAINQVFVVERPFCERWKMLEKEVIEPRNYECQHVYQSRNPYYRYDLEPFRVRRKDFWLLSTVNKLLKEFIPRLSHAADGLIFQMVDNREQLFLYERGKKKLMEGDRVLFSDDSDPASYSGKIIECSWDSGNDVWVCIRIQADKATPNGFNTYKKVMRSITDNITEDVLLNEINETIRLPMYSDRIRNDSKAHKHSNSARRR